MKQNDSEEEQRLFERFTPQSSAQDIPIVFVLAAPRAGSTLLYQLLINCFEFFYFSNLVNDEYAEVPVVGVAHTWQTTFAKLDYVSDYGKTAGPQHPSEASQVFRHWFGGNHPSQTESCRVLPGKERHMLDTMIAIYAMLKLPILAKNAWNCFRIAELMRLFPRASFLWLRRDIQEAAVSDLEARRRRGSPTVWNSATTANYKDIQRRPYWEQVVEQQYEYGRAVHTDLQTHCPDRYLELWYEDVCSSTQVVRQSIRDFFSGRGLPVRSRGYATPSFCVSPGPADMQEDRRRIGRYVESAGGRFDSFLFR